MWSISAQQQANCKVQSSDTYFFPQQVILQTEMWKRYKSNAYLSHQNTREGSWMVFFKTIPAFSYMDTLIYSEKFITIKKFSSLKAMMTNSGWTCFSRHLDYVIATGPFQPLQVWNSVKSKSFRFFQKNQVIPQKRAETALSKSSN